MELLSSGFVAESWNTVTNVKVSRGEQGLKTSGGEGAPLLLVCA